MEMLISYLITFAVGGALCLIAQLLIDLTRMTPARILVLYVTSGVVLTALGIYQPLVDIAGCGATVPLTGFGYSLAKGVEKAVQQDGLIGILTGGLTATAAGIAAALVFGYIVALIFKGKPKS